LYKDRQCNFCSKINKHYKIVTILDSPDIIACDKCIKIPCKFNHTIHKTLKNGDYNNLCVEKSQSTKDKIIYTYSILHQLNYLSFDKLINGLLILNVNKCFCCHNNNIYHQGVCHDCYQFILTKFYNDYWIKINQFQHAGLVSDVNNIIVNYSLLLLTNTTINEYNPNECPKF